jgi:hypothetical protein
MLIQVKADAPRFILTQLQFEVKRLCHDRRLVQADAHAAARRYRLGKQAAFDVSADGIAIITV